MADSCAAWFLSLPASGRLLSAPCRSQRRRPSRRGAVPASALLPPTHRPPHPLHMPVLRPRLHRVPSPAVRRCERAKTRFRRRARYQRLACAQRSQMRRLENAKRAMGGAAAFSAPKRKNPPDRRLPGRAGVQSVASPKVLPAPAGLIRGDRPRLQRHMAIIPCARSPRMQIMCRFALLRS